MSEWQSVDSAPTDVPVEYGWWDRSYRGDGNLSWRTDVGVVWKSRRLLGGRVRVDYGEKAAYWRALPEPPK